jgi:hypothetical protein
LFAAIAFAVMAIGLQSGLTGPAHGALATRFPTYLALDGVAFTMLSVGAAGCVGYAVYQALRARRESPLLKRIGWHTAAAMLAFVGWLALIGGGHVAVALGALGVVGILLGSVIVRAARHPIPLSGAERWLVVGPFSLLAGWTTVACASLAAHTLVSFGWIGSGRMAEGVCVILLAVAVLVASALAFLIRGNIPYAVGATWVLAAIAIRHVADGGSTTSPAFAVVAILAALIVSLMPLVARLPSLRSPLPRPVPRNSYA